jgi:hypothetical protein
MDENILMAARILFVISLMLGTFYWFYKKNQSKMDESLLRSFKILGDYARAGEAPESVIKRVSMMKEEPCSSIFNQILTSMQGGSTFADAIEKVSSMHNSKLLKVIGEILVEEQKTGADIYEVMNIFSQKLNALKYYEAYAKKSVRMNIVTMRILGILIIPVVFHFFPFLIEEITLPAYSVYFMAGYGAILGMLELLVFSDYPSFFVNVPLFSSIPILLNWLMQTYL